jgi:hypothetical protein
MNSESLEIIDLIDKHASAIFSILSASLGALFGFFSNYWFKKLDNKFEVTKDIAKNYYKEKQKVLTTTLQLISDYETKLETLHDFIEDDNGVTIKELKKEDIFVKYFLLVFEYLHSHRLYLEDETIIKLDKLVNFYHLYKLDFKVIKSERDTEDIATEIATLKEKLFKDTKVLFNGLKEQVKFDEMIKFKAKMEQN